MADKDLEKSLRQKVENAGRDSQRAYAEKATALKNSIKKIKSLQDGLDSFGKKMYELYEKQKANQENLSQKAHRK